MAAGALPTTACDRGSAEGGLAWTSAAGTDCEDSVDWFEQADRMNERAIAALVCADLIMSLVWQRVVDDLPIPFSAVYSAQRLFARDSAAPG